MKPILSNQTPAFDASIGTRLYFSYAGNLPYKNRIIIINVATNVVRLDQTISSTEYYRDVPADLLTNGASYTYQIQTFDRNDIASELSDKRTLYCYTTPIFEFDQLTESQMVSDSFVNPAIYYSQLEGEELNEFKITLYNSINEEIYNTGVLYDIESVQKITGLSDTSIYHIRATGTTNHLMSLDTGLIDFSTNFDISSVPTLIEVENICQEGTMKVTSNIRVIEVSVGDEVMFINEEEADLRDNWIQYEIHPPVYDFSFKIKARGFVRYQDCIIFTLGDNKLIVKYMETYDYNEEKQKGYFTLTDSLFGHTVSTRMFDALDGVKYTASGTSIQYDYSEDSTADIIDISSGSNFYVFSDNNINLCDFDNFSVNNVAYSILGVSDSNFINIDGELPTSGNSEILNNSLGLYDYTFEIIPISGTVLSGEIHIRLSALNSSSIFELKGEVTSSSPSVSFTSTYSSSLVKIDIYGTTGTTSDNYQFLLVLRKQTESFQFDSYFVESLYDGISLQTFNGTTNITTSIQTSKPTLTVDFNYFPLINREMELFIKRENYLYNIEAKVDGEVY